MGGNASRIALSLAQPPLGLSGRPNTSSEACQRHRPGPHILPPHPLPRPPCGPPAGACDSGLSQAEAGCQCHSLGHKESHSSIYRQHTASPAWWEEVAAAARASGEPALRKASRHPFIRPGTNFQVRTSSSTPEGPRLGQARMVSHVSTRGGEHRMTWQGA
jgi:hypothetical protein